MQAALAQAARPAMPTFVQPTPPTTPLKTTSAEFKPGRAAWLNSEIKPLKNNAAEFVPGVSAWAGAMNLGNSPKAKSKTKAGKAGSTAPAVEAQTSEKQSTSQTSFPEAPGAATGNADIAAGPIAHEATEALPKDVSGVLIGSEAHAQKSTASNGRLCSLGVALLVGAAIAVPLLRRQR